MKLDHVVFFSNQIPAEIVQEQKKLGRHAIIGGRHEKWGTHNALYYARNAYIEWLSVEHLSIAQHAKHPLTNLLLHDLKEGGGWGTLCLSVDGIEQFDEEVRNKGFQTSGVIDAHRINDSGRLIKWKMLFIEQSVSNELPFPFFIEWEKDEENRLQQLKNEGAIQPENEQTSIEECIFYVFDPLKETGEWAVLLSQKVGDADQIELENATLRFIEHSGEKERLHDIVIS